MLNPVDGSAINPRHPGLGEDPEEAQRLGWGECFPEGAIRVGLGTSSVSVRFQKRSCWRSQALSGERWLRTAATCSCTGGGTQLGVERFATTALNVAQRCAKVA